MVTGIVDRLTAAGITAVADIRKTPVGHIARTICGVADASPALDTGTAGHRC